jgi:hypothetical protein
MDHDFRSIRESCGGYPSGRPEWAAWSRRGEGNGCKACDGSYSTLGRVTECCGRRHFLSRSSETIATYDEAGWTCIPLG